MSEQRMKILGMLSEGKITVDEAQRLLESVSDPGPSTNEWKREQPFKPYEGVEDEEQTRERPVIDLSKVKLSGTVLGDANLEGAKLDGANLSGAVLSGADLENADLRDANLSGTVLSGANLKNADLREANLSGSVMPGADFEGVHHPGLQLSGVVLSPGYVFRDNKLQAPAQTVAGPAGEKVIVNENGDKIVMMSQEDGPVIATIKARPEPKPTPSAPLPPQPPSPPSP